MDILTHLPLSHPWRGQIHLIDSIGSTNTEAKAMAAAGAPHGTVLIARQQTAGRGRMGRSFYSPMDAGLYLSVILRPECTSSALMHLTCAAALAACDAVEAACGMRPGIKWINDLVSGNRKLGGILTELSFIPGTDLVDWAIIGIGINCRRCAYPKELDHIAISLEDVTQESPSPALLAARLVESLFKMDECLLSEQDALMAAYRADCVTLGKNITVHTATGAYPATALDVDTQGGLLVKTENGDVKCVQSGEVSVRGMYGYV